MTSKRVNEILIESIDKLAAIEHERWSHWQKYMHEKGVRQSDGSLTFSPELVARWERQMSTRYADLDEKEKQSDREQVFRYIPLLAAAIEEKLKMNRM